jgi:hypothetical protein
MMTVVRRAEDNALMIYTGCFGDTADVFLERVRSVHGDNEHGIAYRAAVAFAEQVLTPIAVESGREPDACPEGRGTPDASDSPRAGVSVAHHEEEKSMKKNENTPLEAEC